MLEVDEVLDDTYIIKSRLASGGGGIVYKAYHKRLNKYVIIKLIKDEVKGKIDERIEADILKNLKHTYLPQVYDFVIKDDKIYTVMDYITGLSLDKELQRRKRFPQKRVIKWAIQICEALEYLHSNSPVIIHSDIKPANIMLTPDDNICLIDFNVALYGKAFGAIGYTRGYSPPEQYNNYNIKNRMQLEKTNYSDETVTLNLCNNSFASSQADNDIVEALGELNCGKSCIKTNNQPNNQLSEESDIYSLGATIFHLLTGEKNYENELTMESFKSFKFPLNTTLKEIIVRCMRYERKDRFHSARQLKNALQSINLTNKHNWLMNILISLLNILNNLFCKY